MPIQLDTSELVGTLIESVLYGERFISMHFPSPFTNAAVNVLGVAMVFGIKTHNFFRRSNRKYTNVNFMFMFTLWCLMFLSTVVGYPV